MARVDIFSEDMLRVFRGQLRKSGATLVKNKRTGAVHLRHLPDEPPPPSEAQQSAKSDFGTHSQRAAQWLRDNKPDTCPPDGTPEYQRLMRAFKRQDKYKKFFNFVLSRMTQRDGSFVHSKLTKTE